MLARQRFSLLPTLLATLDYSFEARLAHRRHGDGDVDGAQSQPFEQHTTERGPSLTAWHYWWRY